MFEYHKKESPIIGLLGMGGGIGSYIFTAADTGYEIARSLRFNSADSAYLSYSGSAGSNTTWTLSTWIKKTGNDNHVFGAGDGNTPGRFGFTFDGSDKISVFVVDSGSTVYLQNSDAVFRDSSAWYHVVLVADTTNGTPDDRLILYVNGVRQTLSGGAMPLNQNTFVNTAAAHAIGRRSYTASDYFNGYLADVWLIDGSALEPTSFGTFDTYGVWQPKLYTGIKSGVNTFHLPFSDTTSATTLGYDDSGNGNNWTANNIASPTIPTYSLSSPSSSDYISASLDSTVNLTSFTVEGWVYFTNGASQCAIHSPIGTSGLQIRWTSNTQFNIEMTNSAFILQSGTQTFSNNTWYHVVATRDGSNNVALGINGTFVATGTSSASIFIDSSFDMAVGRNYNGGAHNAFYASNVRVSTTARYGTSGTYTVPTSPLSSDANTVYLVANSSTVTNDSKGTYSWTANGSVASTSSVIPSTGSANDSLLDSPSNADTTTTEDTGVGGELAGNYCTLNPLDNYYTTISNGNLTHTGSASTPSGSLSTFFVSSGKWYWEATFSGVNGSDWGSIGVGRILGVPGQSPFSYVYKNNGLKVNDNTSSSYGDTWNTGDVIGVALDCDNLSITFYRNGVSQGVAFSGMSAGLYSPEVGETGGGAYSTANLNFGQRAFAYQNAGVDRPSAEFKSLNTANLPTPTIEEPSNYVGIVTYSGNGTSQTISGLNFAPDFVWIKNRTDSAAHRLLDTIRGATQVLYSDFTDAEFTENTSLTAFNSDGFTVGSENGVNGSTDEIVAWAWKAGGSSDTFNIDGTGYSTASAAGLTSGSITPTGASVNTTTKFSVITWTGTSASDTVDHGLGVAPQLIIARRRNGVANWCVYHVSTGASQGLNLQTTAAAFANTTRYDGTTPTSDVFSVGTSGDINAGNALAYCWAPVKGYSAFGSYTGNGLADGPFIELGFRPAVIITKAYGTTSQWGIWDAERDPYNPVGRALYPSLSNGEVPAGTYPVDFLSNGFKVRSTANFLNATSGVIYAAWAEDPFRSVRAR